MALDPDRQGDAGGADVRRIGEDLRDGEDAVLGVIVADVEMAVAQRAARVEGRIERDLAGVERHGDGQRLEGRAHLVDAGGEPVDVVGIERLLRIARIVVGHRHHRDDFAGTHVENEAGGGLGLELLLRAHQLVAHRVLDAQVDGELDRLLLVVDGEAGAMEIGEAAAVDPLLHAGDALIVHVDVADQVGDLVEVGIDALVLVEEAEAGNAEAVHLLLLARRDLALEPCEPAPGAEALARFGGVEVGHHGGEELERLVGIDDPPRLREQRGHLEIGREDFAVAVEEVGARGRDRVDRSAAMGRCGYRGRRRRARAGRR